MARNDRHFLVAAIDFGTAYSGYAFSVRHDFDKDCTKISAISWNSSTRSLQSLKTPTCVLFDSNKKFDSFGYEAEDKYADLAFDEKHNEWYFFKRFKMKLFNKTKLQRTFTIEDELGKSLPAIDIFSASIGYLKKHLLKTCSDRYVDIRESDILWVLTVPAIWDEAAKQFMREAARKVGITDGNLLLALEPEAASIYCRSQKVGKLVDATGGSSPFKIGSKYLVLDAGGGTVDITVHEVKPDGTLAELHRASGGNWGGTYVDQAFINLISDIVGPDITQQCNDNNMIDMVDLLREFEVKKRTFNPEMNDLIRFKVPVSLNDAFRAKQGKDIKDAISSTKYAQKIGWTGDKVRVESSIIRELFTSVNEGIINHLKALFDEEIMQDVSDILMVGGFSESQMLQTAIRENFPCKRILIPEEAGLAVLKGAVMFGHDPNVISERRCRYTYGFSADIDISDIRNIKEDSIPATRKYYDEKWGVWRARSAFHKHTTIGQQMKVGTPNDSKQYFSDHGNFSLDLYLSIESDPVFVADPSCTKLGSLYIEVAHLLKTDISVNITFSNTELLVEATKMASGEKLNAKFKLLE